MKYFFFVNGAVSWTNIRKISRTYCDSGTLTNNADALTLSYSDISTVTQFTHVLISLDLQPGFLTDENLLRMENLSLHYYIHLTFHQEIQILCRWSSKLNKSFKYREKYQGQVSNLGRYLYPKLFHWATQKISSQIWTMKLKCHMCITTIIQEE